MTIQNRTAVRLSDGRELIYFDETADSKRGEYPDTRQLPPPPPTSQLRYDPLVDEWVAVAAHRQTRTFLPPTNACPLCPSTPAFASEIPAPDYDVAVFENQFPAFSDRVKPGEITSLTGLVPVRPGLGRCEVVCFTSDHNSAFGALPPPGCGPWSTRWPTGPSRCRRCPGWRRSSRSRTAASRSA